MRRLLAAALVALAACGSSVDPASIEISPSADFTLDAIGEIDSFVATVVFDVDGRRTTVEITRSGEFTRSSIDNETDDAGDATFAARGTETYSLVDGSWEPTDSLGAAGFVLLLAVPDVAHEMALEIWQSGTFTGWETWDGTDVARFDAATIPTSIRSEFYAVSDQQGSVWLTEEGVPVRWRATNVEGTASIEWHLTRLGETIELDLPGQLGG